jgi:hypothetical protein
MKVISVIEDQDVIKKVLKHLGLWEVKPRPPPKATRPTKMAEYSIDCYAFSFCVLGKTPCVKPWNLIKWFLKNT